MIFRIGCDPAQRVQVQIVVQMPVYVIQHPLHPGMVVLKRRLHRSVIRGSTSQAHADMMLSTDLAVLSQVEERRKEPSKLEHQPRRAASIAATSIFFMPI